MVKALDLFLKLLERIGRKKLLVNWDGEVIAYRWYVFYVEEDEDDRFIAKFPNVYIHQNLKHETPDGPDSHTHAFNSYSLIMSGGYHEEVDGKSRYNAKGTIAKLKHRQFHRIVKVDPGTMTLFMRGWRKGPWSFKAAPCEKICETCSSEYGACVNTLKETPYELHFSGKGQWRAVRWFPSNTPGLERKLAIRREAIKKVKVLSRDEVNARAAKEHHRNVA